MVFASTVRTGVSKVEGMMGLECRAISEDDTISWEGSDDREVVRCGGRAVIDNLSRSKGERRLSWSYKSGSQVQSVL